jgi:hypothetical protein
MQAIFANKQDLRQTQQVLAPAEVARRLGCDRLRRNWAVFGGSATSGDGLLELMDWICERKCQ